jgi:hypothetical protein
MRLEKLARRGHRGDPASLDVHIGGDGGHGVKYIG